MERYLEEALLDIKGNWKYLSREAREAVINQELNDQAIDIVLDKIISDNEILLMHRLISNQILSFNNIKSVVSFIKKHSHIEKYNILKKDLISHQCLPDDFIMSNLSFLNYPCLQENLMIKLIISRQMLSNDTMIELMNFSRNDKCDNLYSLILNWNGLSEKEKLISLKKRFNCLTNDDNIVFIQKNLHFPNISQYVIGTGYCKLSPPPPKLSTVYEISPRIVSVDGIIKAAGRKDYKKVEIRKYGKVIWKAS